MASIGSLLLHDDAQVGINIEPCQTSEFELKMEMGMERTPLADQQRQGPDVLRSRLLERQRRAASLPSRSPARRIPRARKRVEHAQLFRCRSQVGSRSMGTCLSEGTGVLHVLMCWPGGGSVGSMGPGMARVVHLVVAVAICTRGLTKQDTDTM